MGQIAPFRPAGAGAAEALSRSLGEPDWLLDARRKAWEIYQDAPLPDRVTHLWRYTDPADFEPKAELAPIKAGDRPLTSSAESLADLLKSTGVVVEDLHLAAQQRGELVREHLGSAVPAEHGKFEALNAAGWQGGLLIHVPRGVAVEAPVHLYTEIASATALSMPRLLVILEEGASLTLVDEHAGDPDAGKAAQVWGVAELIVGPSASLRYIGVQRWGRGVTGFMTQRARLARGARYLGLQASFGGSVTKYDIGAVLEGVGSESQIFGVTFGEGRQHFDHHTVHDHRGAKSRSDLDVKVVLKDRARSAYTGLIRIEKDAPDSEAYQENRNLLLSKGTRAESIPELEILTDAVRCTHGATIGSLDPEHIFYLRSRGLSYAESVRMVVGGFLESTLARVPEDLHARLEELVLSRLKEL
jgi:Fe-S cluster assembly protein SufD